MIQRRVHGFDKPFVAVISDIPVHPTVSYEVSKAMIDWTVPIKAREIVSVAGIATMGEDHRVFGGATTPALLERIKDHVERFQVGTISGISGSIMTECFVRGIPAVGLLGETHSPNPDPRAAAAVIGVLNKIYSLSIRVENLIEQADQIETELKSLAEQVRTSTEGGEKPRKEFPMYG